MLKRDGTLTLVRAPEQPLPVAAFGLAAHAAGRSGEARDNGRAPESRENSTILDSRFHVNDVRNIHRVVTPSSKLAWGEHLLNLCLRTVSYLPL
ncbi:MAG: hypothetical protein DME76_08460 [Verrucomicrobia bacterium]|nr:MAG: hypothetical protein DME76_08460 [Verrucomicrobiota bacterium]